MQVLKLRWLALAGICLSLTLVAGCQIDSSTGSSGGELRYVKVSPDLNLNAEPPGYIYELWIFSIGFNREDSLPIVSNPVPLVRFKWDPYLYAASDKDGNFLPLTSEQGMALNTDVAPFFASDQLTAIAFISVEPINDPLPLAPNGPSLMALNINPQSHAGTILNPYALLPFLQLPPPAASFTLLSQSNKKGTPGAQWRDNQTEGNGIWFVNPRLENETKLDSVNCWDSYTKTVVPTAGDAYLYAVWIHKTHPESSFSNFGRVMSGREPDFQFIDGLVVHAAGKFGPSQIIPRPAPNPGIPGVQLGTDPVLVDGVIVGYRYIVPRTTGGADTCIVRIDDPNLSRCNGDTDTAQNFTDHAVLPTSHEITNGDSTKMGPALAGLLDVSNPQTLAQIPNGAGLLFSGWEYEAWLVFTKASGIHPLSLGKFKGPIGLDSDNSHTFTDSRFDRNMHFPGEDFLQNMPAAIGSPLDVIHDPRVEKLWITIEPDHNFQGQNLDWAPDEPNTQLIYLSAWIPKNLDTVESAQFPMVVRDLNPSPNGLNDGNFFPTVTVQFLPAPTQ